MLTYCPCPFLATRDLIFLLVLIAVLSDKGKMAKQSCTHLLRYVFLFFVNLLRKISTQIWQLGSYIIVFIDEKRDKDQESQCIMGCKC
jgi:hypothetical protein